MLLSEEQKKAIEEEYNKWISIQYAGKDKKERQKLGQFFTPPELTIKMLEKFDTIKDKDILDPTCGAGGLLIACILAGADPKRIYGIELDPDIIKVCRKRLLKYGVPPWHFKEGNALEETSYDFDNKEINTFGVVEYSNNKMILTIVNNNKIIKDKEYLDKESFKNAIKLLKDKNIKVVKI